MNAKRAYNLVASKRPTMDVVKCVEYETVFVFQLIPKGSDPKTVYHNALVGVDKETGEIGVFSPLKISVEEYRAGKVITGFK